MTNNENGVIGFPQQPKEDPRIAESKLPVDERLVLAEERSKQINKFLQVEDAVKFHSENIAHLLTEEKYQSLLPVFFSSNTFNSPSWAPYAGTYLTPELNYYSRNNEIILSKFMDELAEMINDGIKLSNLTYSLHPNKNVRLINFIPRIHAEYNPSMVQLCVVVMVKDKEGKILLLKTADKASSRIRNKYTYIQGHVEIDEDVNDMSALDYLTREATREINEEVYGLKYNEADIKFLGLFHNSAEKVSQEHISAVFQLTVDSLKDIATNEDDKHNCFVFTQDEFDKLENVDNIVEAVKPK